MKSIEFGIRSLENKSVNLCISYDFVDVKIAYNVHPNTHTH